MEKNHFDYERSWATRVSAVFAIWSVGWILVSDLLVRKLVDGYAHYWILETWKGVVYVLVTAALLWSALKSRERDQEKMRVSNEQRLRMLKEAGLIGIGGLGDDGKFIYANRCLLNMLGYSRIEDFLGLEQRDLVPAEFLAVVKQADEEFERRGRTSLYKIQLLRKDRSRVPVVVGRALIGSTGGTIAYFLDISPLEKSETERLRLQERLLQAEKVSALGQFASGVAHNFNNELSIMVGYGTVLQEHLASDAAARRYLDQVLSAADRTRKLIQQLLAFSRKQPVHPEIVDINHVIADLQPSLRRLLKENIQLEVRPIAKPLRIKTDPAQFVQVILNLVANAQDAMSDGGTLTIAVEQGARGKNVVILKVIDTGIGMNEATLQHVFEPFFTTKLQSGGTGLGLSSAYGTVRQNGGDIRVASQPGKGTTFTLTFPIVNEDPSAATSAPQPTMPGSMKGTVLLVEDRDDLRHMMSQILSSNGLTVFEAKDGIEAVKAAQSSPIDLIVTDIVMPRLSGPEAVQFIRTFRPTVKVIFVSGSADMLQPNGRDIVIWKPVKPGALLQAIRACLLPTPASSLAA